MLRPLEHARCVPEHTIATPQPTRRRLPAPRQAIVQQVCGSGLRFQTATAVTEPSQVTSKASTESQTAERLR